MTSVVPVDWARASSALRAEVHRTVALLRSIGSSSAPAVGEWNLAEVAMHLSQAWIVVPGLARRDLSRIYDVLPDRTGPVGSSLLGDLWELGGFSLEGVRSDPERDPRVIAGRIEERADEFFAECEGRSADELHPWLVQGVSVPLATLTCHLLSETVVHGADVARAAGRPWRIVPDSAVLAIQGFVFPVFARLDPTTMVDQQRAAGVRATYDVRLRGGGGAVHLVFADGALHVEAPGPCPVDCHISADPVALLEVMWGRRSQWGAIATGKLVAWGRRPWLGPRLRTLLRNP